MKKETTKKTKAELLEIIEKLEEENRLLRENAAPEPEEKPDTKEQMEALKRIIQIRGDVIRALKDVVAMSCKDHCPHHAMEEACHKQPNIL